MGGHNPTPMQIPASSQAETAPAPHSSTVAGLEHLSNHRRHVRPVARTLERLPQTALVGHRMNSCATRLGLALQQTTDEREVLGILSGWFCNARLCPWCEWRRTRAWRGRLIRGLAKFSEEHPTHRGIFLTLTVRNCPLEATRDTLDHLHKSWNRLTKCSFFPTGYWLRRTEITLGSGPRGDDAPPGPRPSLWCTADVTAPDPQPDHSGPIQRHRNTTLPLYAHPHLHAVLLVPASYFGRGYVRQTEWARQWMMAARLDYIPIVDVRPAKSRAGSPVLADAAVDAIREAAKYIAKSTDIAAMGDQVALLHNQLKRKRMISLSTPLSRYVKSGDITHAEMLDGSEIYESGTPLQLAVAHWDALLSTYQLTALT